MARIYLKLRDKELGEKNIIGFWSSSDCFDLDTLTPKQWLLREIVIQGTAKIDYTLKELEQIQNNIVPRGWDDPFKISKNYILNDKRIKISRKKAVEIAKIMSKEIDIALEEKLENSIIEMLNISKKLNGDYLNIEYHTKEIDLLKKTINNPNLEI